MKKTIFFIMMLFWTSILFAGKAAEKQLEKIFKNYSNITTVEADADITTEETAANIRGKKIKSNVKKVLIKKADRQNRTDNKRNKKKVILLDEKTRQPLSVQQSESMDRKPEPAPALYPYHLFDPKNYFKNFKLSITVKDERIKIRGEEIIAIRKGQEREYPQIRIDVQNNRIKKMRFYSISGKRYYTMTVNKYIKIKGFDVPVEITEHFNTKKNEIKNDINYTIIRLNEPISDSDFD